MTNEERAEHKGSCHTGGDDCPECKAELEMLKKEFVGLQVTEFHYANGGGYIELDHRYKIRFPVAMIMKRQVQ